MNDTKPLTLLSGIFKLFSVVCVVSEEVWTLHGLQRCLSWPHLASSPGARPRGYGDQSSVINRGGDRGRAQLSAMDVACSQKRL